jgi:hypothetical protein
VTSTTLREAAQRRLVEFLEVDLDLGFTYLKMAETREERRSRERLRRNARRAVEAVRRFEGRITDPTEWTAIHERADELQRLLSAFRT